MLWIYLFYVKYEKRNETYPTYFWIDRRLIHRRDRSDISTIAILAAIRYCDSRSGIWTSRQFLAKRVSSHDGVLHSYRYLFFLPIIASKNQFRSRSVAANVPPKSSDVSAAVAFILCRYLCNYNILSIGDPLLCQAIISSDPFRTFPTVLSRNCCESNIDIRLSPGTSDI